MHVYRNRRYEEEIVMLTWHKKGEQRMIETRKQKTQIQELPRGHGHGYSMFISRLI